MPWVRGSRLNPGRRRLARGRPERRVVPHGRHDAGLFEQARPALVCIQAALTMQVVHQVVDQHFGREAAGFPAAGPQPVAEHQHGVKRRMRPFVGGGGIARRHAEQKAQAALETPRVGQQIPIPCQPHEPLHVGSRYTGGLLYGIRWLGVVHHAVLHTHPGDRRSAQPLEHTELDFVRAQCQQTVESRLSTVRSLSWRREISCCTATLKVCTPTSNCNTSRGNRAIMSLSGAGRWSGITSKCTNSGGSPAAGSRSRKNCRIRTAAAIFRLRT